MCFGKKLLAFAFDEKLTLTIAPWNYNTLVNCGAQLVGGYLLKELQYFEVM